MALVIIIISIPVLFFAALFFWNRAQSRRWKRNPSSSGRIAVINGRPQFYSINGEGPSVILESGGGLNSSQWDNIQDRLSKKARVFTYDRAGLGWSGPPHEERTLENIAHELHDLVQSAGLKPPYLLAGHSLGGLYMQVFARLYPGEIKSVVLLDPLYLEDRFKGRISGPLYRKIIRKEPMMKLAGFLGRLGLVRLFKMAAFGTNAGIPERLKRSFIEIYSDPEMVKTAIEEIAYAEDQNIAGIRDIGRFPEIPLTVVYHSPQKVIDQLKNYKVAPEEAEKIERIWCESIHGEYEKLSPYFSWITAPNSTHNITLEDEELVVKTIMSMLSDS